MRAFLPALAVSLLLVSTTGYGQNETQSYTSSLKTAIESIQLPDGNSSAQINLNHAIKHKFAITEEQEAALSQGGSFEAKFHDITLVFRTSDDPKWQPGATSIKIKKTSGDSVVVEKSNVTAKWGNGQLSISVKVAVTLMFGASKTMTDRAPGHPNSTTSFETAFIGSTDFASKGHVSFDSKNTSYETVKNDGMRTSGNIIFVKSKNLVEAPLP